MWYLFCNHFCSTLHPTCAPLSSQFEMWEGG
jgi:hypothetical protein